MIRGAPILVFMFCLGLGVLSWQLSGIGAVVGPSPNEDLESGGELEDQANESGPDGSFNSSTNPDDGDVVGLILTSVDAFARVVGFVVLLPFELEKLGLPWFAAYPSGLLAQSVTGIAFVQAVSSRIYR